MEEGADADCADGCDEDFVCGEGVVRVQLLVNIQLRRASGDVQ